MTALARLATGRPGPETEAMIAAFLDPIADCWDCADFYLVPLLWIRARFAAALSPGLLAEIDRTILAYRYWLDEPGNDVQWYFSENHALLMHTCRLPRRPPPPRRHASPAPAAPAPRSPPPAAPASAPGSTISSAGRWPSSTPPPTSPSTSRA